METQCCWWPPSLRCEMKNMTHIEFTVSHDVILNFFQDINGEQTALIWDAKAHSYISGWRCRSPSGAIHFSIHFNQFSRQLELGFELQTLHQFAARFTNWATAAPKSWKWFRIGFWGTSGLCSWCQQHVTRCWPTAAQLSYSLTLCGCTASE